MSAAVKDHISHTTRSKTNVCSSAVSSEESPDKWIRYTCMSCLRVPGADWGQLHQEFWSRWWRCAQYMSAAVKDHVSYTSNYPLKDYWLFRGCLLKRRYVTCPSTSTRYRLITSTSGILQWMMTLRPVHVCSSERPHLSHSPLNDYCPFLHCLQLGFYIEF